MRRLVMLILSVLIIFAAVRVGWPAAIAVLTLATGLYAWVLLKDTPYRVRVTILLTLFVAEALLIAWGIRWTLKQIEQMTTASESSWPLFDFFAGSDLLQNFWALLGGFVISGFLFGLLALTNAALHIPLSGKPNKATRDDKFTLTWRRALGLVPAKWTVQNGEIITVKAPKPPQQPRSGPGELEIQRGHAVILEKEGAISVVLPAGVYWVQQYERIAMVVPLFGRADQVMVRNAATLDGLQIEEMEIKIFHKVLAPETAPGVPDNAASPDGDDLFRFSEIILRNRVWSASGNTWENGVKGVTEREARSVIADYTMEELVTMNGSKREEFKQRLEKQINLITEGYMGVSVTVTGFGAINAPDLAGEKLMAAWTAEKDRAIAQAQAELQAELTVLAAGARSSAFRTLVDAMDEALRKGHQVQEVLAMSFVERMERVESETNNSSASQDLEALSRLYIVEALKSLTNRTAPREETKGA